MKIVIASNGGLDFEALQLRIHPAASRVKLLSQQIPASIVFFDMLLVLVAMIVWFVISATMVQLGP